MWPAPGRNGSGNDLALLIADNGLFEFCLPTLGKAVPAGAEWFHEIKNDGYRLRIEREGERVRLITKGATIGLSASPGSSRRP